MSKAKALGEELQSNYHGEAEEDEPANARIEDLLYVIGKTLVALLAEAEEQTKHLRNIEMGVDALER